MYSYITPLLLLLLCANLPAQSYTFSTRQEIYVERTGGLSLNQDTIWMDDPAFQVPLGFIFPWFDVPTDSLYFRGLYGQAVTNINIPDEDVYGPANLLYYTFSDIADRGSAGGGSSLSRITYHVTGASPTRIGILQFSNVGFEDEIVSTGTSTIYVNFQLWLYEADGTIEMHYGPSSPSMQYGTDTIETVFVLVKGLLYNDDIDTSTVEEIQFIKGDPANPVAYYTTEIVEDEDYELDGYPASGTVYRFAVISPSSLFTPAAAAVETLGVFPNPTTGRLALRYPDDRSERIAELQLYSATGRRLRDFSFPSATVDLSGLPNGMYQLRATTSSGRSLLGHVLKQ